MFDRTFRYILVNPRKQFLLLVNIGKYVRFRHFNFKRKKKRINNGIDDDFDSESEISHRRFLKLRIFFGNHCSDMVRFILNNANGVLSIFWLFCFCWTVDCFSSAARRIFTVFLLVFLLWLMKWCQKWVEEVSEFGC